MSTIDRRPGASKSVLQKCSAVAATASILIATAWPVHAQTDGGTGSGTGAGTGTGAGMGTSGLATGATGSRAAGKSAVASVDQSIMKDMAHSNLGEIEAGKLALEKSQSAEVKKYAQQMIDEHTKAQGELQQMAEKKGVTLPDGPGPVNVTRVTAMRALTGETFDNQYMKRAGVGDHEATLKLLQKAQKEGKDPDLKAMATKMTPVVQKHLKMAQGMAMGK